MRHRAEIIQNIVYHFDLLFLQEAYLKEAEEISAQDTSAIKAR